MPKWILLSTFRQHVGEAISRLVPSRKGMYHSHTGLRNHLFYHPGCHRTAVTIHSSAAIGCSLLSQFLKTLGLFCISWFMMQTQEVSEINCKGMGAAGNCWRCTLSQLDKQENGLRSSSTGKREPCSEAGARGGKCQAEKPHCHQTCGL